MLASELIARHYEEKNSCDPTITDKELKISLKKLEDKIGVLNLLEGIHVSSTQLKEARNLILHIEPDRNLRVFGYSKTNPALEKYFELEEAGVLTWSSLGPTQTKEFVVHFGTTFRTRAILLHFLEARWTDDMAMGDRESAKLPPLRLRFASQHS